MAVALLGSCLLGLLTVIVSGLDLADRSDQITIATEIARDEMEAIKERGFTWPPGGEQVYSGDRPRDRGFPPAPYPRVTRDGWDYLVTVTIGDVATSVRNVRVQVRWGERGEVSLETYLHP